jgi:hypothetical protein
VIHRGAVGATVEIGSGIAQGSQSGATVRWITSYMGTVYDRECRGDEEECRKIQLKGTRGWSPIGVDSKVTGVRGEGLGQ